MEMVIRRRVSVSGLGGSSPGPFFLSFLLLPLWLLCLGSSASRTSHHSPDRYILRSKTAPGLRCLGGEGDPQEYFDPTFPPLLPRHEDPSCSVHVLEHDFAHTYGFPPAHGNFTPPVNCEWDRAVLEFSASCAGEQYDRIAAVWIDGVEVLRTSTAEPTESGVFWNVRKDVTRYSSLLTPREHYDAGENSKLRHVWVMLENVVNDVFTGVYHVNVSLHFYEEGIRGGSDYNPRARILGESEIPKCPLVSRSGAGPLRNSWGRRASSPSPHGSYSLEERYYDRLLGKAADLVLPVSNDKGSQEGFWFRIQKEGDEPVAGVKIPKNAYRAVLEIYVSFHGDDEFWYSNPPDSYIQMNHLPTRRGNGAFREVYATVDGLYAGSILAFPVVFTGGFNPLFWAPVVAIGAFDLPSYSLDVTPLLGVLLRGGSHRIGLGVNYSIPFWLVNANLHLWLDPHLASVAADVLEHQVQPTTIAYSNKFQHLDGLFKSEARRRAQISGWVSSSLGNLTYTLERQLKYKSSILFQENGNNKETYSKAKYKTDMKIEEGPNHYVVARVYHKAKYPIKVVTAAEPRQHESSIRTNLSHVMYEKDAIATGKTVHLSSITNTQNADGWMLVQDHSVLSGSASTRQQYKYMNNGICYVRKMSAQDGNIVEDRTSTDCRFQK